MYHQTNQQSKGVILVFTIRKLHPSPHVFTVPLPDGASAYQLFVARNIPLHFPFSPRSSLVAFFFKPLYFISTILPV